ncbi:type II toxin-antitoxin system death-on-curing family toxin [Natronoglycomyces albus]|uniref:Type II toxin-antitoxin system death-on-curing family toxin n=1 Tax=Natronoglycomyces albus TaxID=2811108 RepID=A0A895XND6_9ACTN|nr:type II toxin-antitoxin system death-on-curing family toxin [Natronoglycomyces albus]QSB05292.1 type II toxin-antitoxin system death-on-curing family toxin [Natronoglycomyces albus]
MSTRHFTVEQLLDVAEFALNEKPLVRDPGLLESACNRPAASYFGAEQYPTLMEKAAAFMHSIARFHPLVDGNKRLAWLGTVTFLRLNGATVTATNREAVDLTLAVASGELSEVHDIAEALTPYVVLPGE